MSETLQFDPIDDGEPPSSSRDEIIHKFLDQLGRHGGTAYYSELRAVSDTLKIRLTHHAINATLQGDGYARYRRLDGDEKRKLEYTIEAAMARLAREYYFDDLEGPDDTRVMCNAAPLLFEPIDHAMLLGVPDDDRERIEIESRGIESDEQQRILLGGLAVLAWRLEQQTD